VHTNVFAMGLAVVSALAQPPVEPQILTRHAIENNVGAIRLATRFTTAIRLPDPVSSVALGDPSLFHVEHSDREPSMVFVKPLTTKPAQTNLLITTMRGRHVSVLLVSRGDSLEDDKAVDFLVRYKPAGRFMIEPSDYPSALIGQTTPLQPAAASISAESAHKGVGTTQAAEHILPDELLERQRRAPLPTLYGPRAPSPSGDKERVRAGISEVIDQGRQVLVLFSAVNPQAHAIELMAPQIQLGGKTKSGTLIRRSRWSTAEQLPVTDFRMSRRRLGPGERGDGVVVFDRPPFKQSNETLFLQVAESGAVDRPALAPIGFGISTLREEVQHGTATRSKGR